MDIDNPTNIREVDNHILDFRGDWEAITRMFLSKLNDAVRRRATVRFFRPISMGALLSRALRIYDTGVEIHGQEFYGRFMNYLSTWATNNGVPPVGNHPVHDRMVALTTMLSDWLAGEPPFGVSRDWLDI